MLLDVMPDAAVVVDGTGTIVAFNRMAQELFDYEGEDLAGTQIEALVPDRFRDVHHRDCIAYSAAPRTRAMGAGLKLYGRRRDGSEFPVDISLAPVGRPDRPLVVAAVRDRTEHERATADFAQLAAIVNSSSDAIFSISSEGKVTTWNPGACQLFSYVAEEMIGQHINCLFPQDGSPEFEEIHGRVVAEQKTGPRDAKWLTKSGQTIDVAISLSPLKEPGGRRLGISVMARDIAQRKQAEALARRQDRVQASTADVRLSMLSNSPLEETFRLICGRVDEILDAQGTLVAVMGDSGLKVVAAAGVLAPYTEVLLDETTPLIKGVLESGASRVVTIREANLGGQLGGQLPLDDEVAMAPLRSDRGPLGVLATVGRPGDLATPERPIIEGLAGSAVLAIELAAARQAREHLLLASDRERIARDLHDVVIQRLFGTGMALQGVLGFIDNGRVAGRVAAAVDDLDATIREIRTAIFALEAPRPAQTGLRAEILRLVAAMNDLGFEPSVHFDGPVDSAVSDEVKSQLLAVVREALSNIARHANASRADVDLRVGDDIVLVVSDDGAGIGDINRESGLANLRVRAANLNGAMKLGPAPGGGARLEWRIPLRL
jgi:PAS domain S-box-containing protein